jgi:hypothetical protein
MQVKPAMVISVFLISSLFIILPSLRNAGRPAARAAASAQPLPFTQGKSKERANTVKPKNVTIDGKANINSGATNSIANRRYNLMPISVRGIDTAERLLIAPVAETIELRLIIEDKSVGPQLQARVYDGNGQLAFQQLALRLERERSIYFVTIKLPAREVADGNYLVEIVQGNHSEDEVISSYAFSVSR